MRDEETGEIWSPTALPIRENTARYVARHGQGYSRFEHTAHGIALELLQFVPLDDPVKISRLKLTQSLGRARRLSVTAYVEWVLGTSRGAAAPYIVTEIDPQTGAMFARNPWSTDFGDACRLRRSARPQNGWTGDRPEFLAATARSTAAPRSRRRAALHRVGAGLDPCGALQTQVELGADGATRNRRLPRPGGDARQTRKR